MWKGGDSIGQVKLCYVQIVRNIVVDFNARSQSLIMAEGEMTYQQCKQNHGFRNCDIALFNCLNDSVNTIYFGQVSHEHRSIFAIYRLCCFFDRIFLIN